MEMQKTRDNETGVRIESERSNREGRGMERDKEKVYCAIKGKGNGE